MRSEEFLLSFQEALVGKVPDIKIKNHVNYYKCYIQKQVQSGKTEEEVLQTLGNPRLLAKTIIESEKFAVENDKHYDSEQCYQQSYQEQKYQDNDQDYNRNEKVKHTKSFQVPSIVIGILCIVGMALLIGLAFCVISYLAPVILIIVIGVCVFRIVERLFRGY